MSNKLSKRSGKKYRIQNYDSDGSTESLYDQIQAEENSKLAIPGNCCRMMMIAFLCCSAALVILTEGSDHVLGILEQNRMGEMSGSMALQNLKGKLAPLDSSSKTDKKETKDYSEDEDPLAKALQSKIDTGKISAEISSYQNDNSDTLSIHQALLRPKSLRTRNDQGIHHVHGKEFKTRNRILSLGGSTTWGSKLGDREEAYPSILAKMMGKHWDFVNLAVRATDAAYASQCIESMVREGSKSIDDMVADFDVILLEYSLNGLDGLSLLLSRLRRRYPNAVIVYVHLWSLRMTVDDAETGERPRAVLNDAQNFEEADKTINNLLSDPHTEWKWSDTMMADSKQVSMDALDAALKVDGFVYEFPVPENPKEAMKGGWFGKDYHHLSSKGHHMVADAIYELLKRPETKPKEDPSSKYAEHTWGKGDSCYSWFETGESPAVNFKGGNMKMFVNPDKWALHVTSDKPATIKFPNDKSEAQPVDLVIMSWGEGVYPKANMKLSHARDSGGDDHSFLLDPVHPLEWQRIYHITRTVHVGWAEPGKNELAISPIETTKRPLRVTGIIMCGACVEMDPTYLSVEVGQGHGEVEHADNMEVSIASDKSVEDNANGSVEVTDGNSEEKIHASVEVTDPQVEQTTKEGIEVTDTNVSTDSIQVSQQTTGADSADKATGEQVENTKTDDETPESVNHSDGVVAATDATAAVGSNLINQVEGESHKENSDWSSVEKYIVGFAENKKTDPFGDNASSTLNEDIDKESEVTTENNDVLIESSVPQIDETNERPKSDDMIPFLMSGAISKAPDSEDDAAGKKFEEKTESVDSTQTSQIDDNDDERSKSDAMIPFLMSGIISKAPDDSSEDDAAEKKKFGEKEGESVDTSQTLDISIRNSSPIKDDNDNGNDTKEAPLSAQERANIVIGSGVISETLLEREWRDRHQNVPQDEDPGTEKTMEGSGIMRQRPNNSSNNNNIKNNNIKNNNNNNNNNNIKLREEEEEEESEARSRVSEEDTNKDAEQQEQPQQEQREHSTFKGPWSNNNNNNNNKQKEQQPSSIINTRDSESMENPLETIRSQNEEASQSGSDNLVQNLVRESNSNSSDNESGVGGEEHDRTTRDGDELIKQVGLLKYKPKNQEEIVDYFKSKDDDKNDDSKKKKNNGKSKNKNDAIHLEEQGKKKENIPAERDESGGQRDPDHNHISHGTLRTSAFEKASDEARAELREDERYRHKDDDK